MIDREGGADNANKPFTPDQDVDGGYHGRGNDNEWGERYATRSAASWTPNITSSANTTTVPWSRTMRAAKPCCPFGVSSTYWLGLRASFPNAKFEIHHQIGMDGDMLPPRASVRWSLDDLARWLGHIRPANRRPRPRHGHVPRRIGPFVHSEDGPRDATIRRETSLYDEVAIWKQIIMQSE